MIAPHSHPRMEGISAVAKRYHWSLMMSDRLVPGERLTSFDGVLMTVRKTADSRAAARKILAAGVPFVDLTLECPDLKINRVISDHGGLGARAARHFADRGFEHFAWFSTAWTNVHALRMDGFRRALPATARFTKLGQKGLAAALKAAAKPLAVLAYNDADAARVLHCCRQLDLDVPMDVSVIGIGNDRFLCENQMTPISSVEQNLAESAAAAAELLEELMTVRVGRRKAPAVKVTGAGSVVSRESTDTLVHEDPTVRRALIYIHANIRRSIGTPQVAEAVGVCRKQLERLFTTKLRRTVREEILEQRLARARRLLKDGEIAISAISKACGFCNPAHFTNTFVKRYGTNPRAWRERQLGQ